MLLTQYANHTLGLVGFMLPNKLSNYQQSEQASDL